MIEKSPRCHRSRGPNSNIELAFYIFQFVWAQAMWYFGKAFSDYSKSAHKYYPNGVS
jgi:hypothetical protein